MSLLYDDFNIRFLQRRDVFFSGWFGLANWLAG